MYMLNQTDAIIAHDAAKAISALDDMKGFFSDRYKDAYGMRPRFHGDWDMATVCREIDRLDGVEAPEPPMPTSGEGWALTPAGA
jgi:hypothetical protein